MSLIYHIAYRIFAQACSLACVMFHAAWSYVFFSVVLLLIISCMGLLIWILSPSGNILDYMHMLKALWSNYYTTGSLLTIPAYKLHVAAFLLWFFFRFQHSTQN